MTARLPIARNETTLLDELGGLDRMREILHDFYEHVFEDLLIGFMFQGRDKATLVERQLQFTARAWGADVAYEGKPIPEAHAGLPILPGHFDRRHKLLADALVRHAVPERVREAWLELDRSFRRAVVKQGERARG